MVELNEQGKIDLAILHGDGSNTVAKLGKMPFYNFINWRKTG